MNTGMQPSALTVEAARDGEQAALDALIAECLPLVYNVVGRALDGHADVDDVVQETMVRVVRGLDGLRDPESFRSWLMSIALRQVREQWRIRQARPVVPLSEEMADSADPGADFVDLTILRLGLSGQRVEVAEASRWLDQDDRDVLSLWWLEAAGELTRTELAAGCGLSPQHAAVRVQRVKARLDAARGVVRALACVPRCGDLEQLIGTWNGLPSGVWRKRIARHVRECASCARQWQSMLPAEGLLAGLGLVPLPIGYTVAGLMPGPGTGERGAGEGCASRRPGRRAARAAARRGPGRAVAAVASAAVAVVGGAVALTFAMPGDHGDVRATTGGPAAKAFDAVAAPTEASPPSAAGVTASPVPSHAPRGTGAAKETKGSGRAAGPATKKDGPVYGQSVDTVDSAPPADAKPAPLPKRPQGAPLAVTGKYSTPFKGSLGGRYLMFWRGDHVTITGRGYFCVRYEIAWFNRAGLMQMPTWTGLEGKLFHVASGGGRRMTDNHPGEPARHTWMGNPDAGYITLPAGAQQMWQNEYFYLDGTVTLHENETGPADYNLSVTPNTWAEVSEEINAVPTPGAGIVRYGLVRDTGDDSAPVPQYLTRATPADPTSVRQRSQVRTSG